MSNGEQLLVLVADDEPSTLALVAAHMRSKGHKVIEASDGDEAWERAHEHLPHLVVLDVMMPGMSGWEVCRKIRETVSLAHTAVVMLTGIGENLNEMTSPLYGADAYVDKPFEFSVLDQHVQEALEKRQQSGDGSAGAIDFEWEAGSPAADDDDEAEAPEPVSRNEVTDALNRVLGRSAADDAPAATEDEPAKKPAAKKPAAKKPAAKKPAAKKPAAKKKATKKAAKKKATKKAAKKKATKKAAKKKATKKAAKKKATKKAAKKKATKKAAKKKATKKAAKKKATKKAAKRR